MSDPLFGHLFSAPAVLARTDELAWLQAMLDVEAALARAGTRAGLVPAEAAQAIAEQCRAEYFDVADLGRRAVASATPVVPLVRDLTARVPESARPYVHHGATSQDIVDTALMLIVRRAGTPIRSDLTAAADRLAELAAEHRGTPQIGRTLMQQAAPTTFGLVCAGWLTDLDAARAGLARLHEQRLAVQCGGAVGNLAALGGHGPRVVAELAAELGLAEPVLPWHTARGRIGELAGTLGVVAGVLGTIALDVTLLSQTEVGEVTEGTPGGSSTMPHKRNPARSVLVTACVHQVPGLVATLLAAMPQEAQRAAGRWQAEWPAVTQLLRLVGGAAAHSRELLTGLQVDTARMRANLDLTQGVVMAQSVTDRLVEPLGRARASELVTDASRRALAQRRPLRAVLLDAPEVAAAVPAADLDAALDPTGQLATVAALVDRALDAHDKPRVPGDAR
jgi:3-carboxy-cis,cis-muconate cycloisomerase